MNHVKKKIDKCFYCFTIYKSIDKFNWNHNLYLEYPVIRRKKKSSKCHVIFKNFFYQLTVDRIKIKYQKFNLQKKNMSANSNYIFVLFSMVIMAVGYLITSASIICLEKGSPVRIIFNN